MSNTKYSVGKQYISYEVTPRGKQQNRSGESRFIELRQQQYCARKVTAAPLIELNHDLELRHLAENLDCAVRGSELRKQLLIIFQATNGMRQ